jgi:hypothetical protein
MRSVTKELLDAPNQTLMNKSLLRTSIACAAFLMLLVLQVSPAGAQVTVGPQDTTGAVGDTVSIAVEAGDLSQSNVASYQFTATYDDSVIEVIGAEIENTLSSGGNVEVNTENAGEAQVAFASDEVLGGPGTLIELQAVLSGAGSTTVSLEEARFFDRNGQEVTGDVDVTDGAVEAFVAVTAPDLRVLRTTDSLEIPIRVGDLAGAEVTSYQFTLAYDPDVIDITDAITEGTMSEEEELQFNKTAPDTVKVSFASSGDPLEGPGTLLRFQASTEGVGASPLDVEEFVLGGSDVPTTVTDGSVTVTEVAQAQFIHNAADPAAEAVDVYFGDERVLDDFEFRSATQYLDVPADVEIDVGVAPASSESAADTLASFPLTFSPDQSHTVVANGVLSPGDFADNPDGESIGFEFFVDDSAREEASSADSVDLRAVHGATDAPTVDIETNGTTLFDDVVYGDISGYISSAPTPLRLVVTPGGSDDAVAAFEADLSGLGGQSATVLASGFLNPAANQGGPGFALVAALSNGDVVVFEQSLIVDVSRDFGDASVQANYELVALPGDVDIDLVEGAESGFSGEQGPDWRAFRELGATNGGDAELEAYDGSDAFNFREGRAFWVISKDQLSYQGTASSTSASAIDLQGGWNAISNPLRSDLDWQAVQNANGLDEALFRWNGGWEQVDTLRSAQTGEGYYVFNSADLDSLSLSEEENENALASGEGSSRTVNLAVRDEGDKGSSITAGIGSETSTHRAPPTHFSSPKTTLRVLGSDSGNRYVRMVRSVDGESTTFGLMLRGEESKRATLEASGLGAEGPEGAVLVEEETGQSYDLQETSTVTIEMGDDGEARLSLHVGSSEVNDIVAPDETELRGNYPNPFSQQTTVELALSEQADVKVRVYNVLGQKVATVADGEMDAGTHKLGWDGSSLSSGVYFVRMEAGSKTDVHKVTVVR